MSQMLHGDATRMHQQNKAPPLQAKTWNKLLESTSIGNEPWFPYHEWNIDYAELTVGSRIGIGFFGEVFRGTWNEIEVAIKVLLEQEVSAKNIEEFCNEISILSRLRHPNVHRDLKSKNCLVNKHWIAKMCDFGLSRVLTTEHMRDCSSAGTPEWMVSELIRNEQFTEKCDIFRLGVINWELCIHRPWEGISPAQVSVFKRFSDTIIRFSTANCSCFMLIAEPEQRPNCEEILSRLMSFEMLI